MNVNFFLVILVIVLSSCYATKNTMNRSHEEPLAYSFSYPSADICLPDSLGGDSLNGTIYYQILLNKQKDIEFKRVISIRASNRYINRKIIINPSNWEELKRWDVWMNHYVSGMTVSVMPQIPYDILLVNALKLDKGCPCCF